MEERSRLGSRHRPAAGPETGAGIRTSIPPREARARSPGRGVCASTRPRGALPPPGNEASPPPVAWPRLRRSEGQARTRAYRGPTGPGRIPGPVGGSARGRDRTPTPPEGSVREPARRGKETPPRGRCVRREANSRISHARSPPWAPLPKLARRRLAARAPRSREPVNLVGATGICPFSRTVLGGSPACRDPNFCRLGGREWEEM